MIHPTIAACLPAGFQSAPVMRAMQIALSAPPAPPGLFDLRFKHATGTLVCHLDYEPPDDGAPDQYGQPTHMPSDERMVLVAAYCNGGDIEHLIGDLVREEIEQAALDAWHSQRNEARADAAVD